ncbi:MAG: porin [Bdellovibrionota bacterium]
MRKLLILAAGLLLLPAVSNAATLEELLVEKGVITKGEANAAMHTGNAKVYWNKGTRLEFPDTGFTAKFNTQIQSRYTFTDNESGQNSSSFDMRRVRLQVSGTALHGEFSYKLQADFVGDSGDGDGRREPDLRDAYLSWHACDWVDLRMGQFKTAVSRQENTSSAFLQFPDRSVASDTFSQGRKQGLHAGFQPSESVTLGAAIFNGESIDRNETNPNTRHTAVVDGRFNISGDMDPYMEGDIDHTDGTAVNAGFAYSYSESQSESALLNDPELHRLSVDGNVKTGGFSLHGEFFWADESQDLIGGGTAVDGTPIGAYVQAGYFLNDKLELAGRWSMVDCDDGAASLGSCGGGLLDDVQEVSASLNYYFWQHYLKAQLGWNNISEDPIGGGSSVDTNEIIFQLSGYM